MHDFIATCVRYATHVNAYFSLAADPFPDFGGAPGYPVDVEIAPPQKQSRLTIFFRGILAIPACIVLYLLGYVAQIVMFFAWFIALFTGRLHSGLRDVLDVLAPVRRPDLRLPAALDPEVPLVLRRLEAR